MLCFRRACPFGLPDDSEAIDDIVLVSVGHALGVVTAHIAEEPLPAPLARLLARLQRRERNARTRRNTAVRPQPGTRPRPADPRPAIAAAGEPQAAL
jgi:hypothetical protein